MSAGETIVSTLKAKLLLDTLGFTQNADSASKSVSDMALKFRQVGKVTSDVVKDTVKSAMEFETAFTGVTKTVNAPKGKDAGEFFGNLKNEILDMSAELPVAATEIAGVYQAAGQLGIEAENLTTFSRAMLQLSSATNLTSEEAATSLAQFANVMQTDQTQFENMGSAIVALGNNFATNERQVVSFAQELAMAGKLAGMSEADVLGWGTAMASMGLEAASSGTAFQRFAQQVTTAVSKGNSDLTVLAKTAGVSAEEFATAWNEDATGALQMFLDGLGQMSSAEQIGVFDQLEIGQQQEITMLQSLASNTNLVTAALAMSNKEWKNNSALSQEAGTANATTAAQLQILMNRITHLAITVGDILLPVFNDILKALTPLIEKIRTFAQEHPMAIKVILAFGLALGVIGTVITTLLPLVSAITGAGGLAAIGTTLAGIIGPAMPVIGVIALIIAAFLALKIAIEKNFLGLGDRFNELKETVKTAFEGIKGYFNDLKGAFEEGGWSAVFEKIGNDAAGLWNNHIKPWFDQIGNNIRGFFENFDLGESVKALGSKIGSGVSGFWNETIKPFFDQIGDNIRGFFENLEIVQSIEAFFAPVGEKFEEFKNTVTEKLEPIKEKFEELKTSISEKLEPVKEKFEEFKSKLEEMKTGVSEKIETIKQKWEEFRTAVSEKFESVKTKIDEFIQKPEELRAAIEEKVNSIKEKWEELKSALTEKIEEIKSKFDEVKGKISTFLDGVDLSAALQAIVDSIVTAVNGWWDLMKTPFEGIITFIKEIFSGADLTEALGAMVGKIKSNIEGWWETYISEPFETLKTNIVNFFQGLDVSEGVETFITGVKNTINSLWEKVKSAFTGEDGFVGKVKTWFGEIDLTAAASNLIGKIKTGIASSWDTLKSWFTQQFTGLFDNIQIPDWLNPSNWWKKIKGVFNGGDGETSENTIDMPENMLKLDYENLQPLPDTVIASYERFRTAIEGINTAMTNLQTALSGETMQSFQNFIGIKFDDSMLESWLLLEEALSGVGNALMSIMIVLTGGEFGEEGELGALGDKQAGQPLVEGFQAFSDAAAELAPLIDSSINTVLKSMASYTGTIYKDFNALVVLWTTEFKRGVKVFVQEAAKAEASTNSIAKVAHDAAGAFLDWADAIGRVIEQLLKLASINGGDTTPPTGMPGRASGGPVRHGDTYLVGEEGPELFTPHRSGYIVPNDELMNGKSGSQEIKIEINGNIYGESYLEEFVVGTMTNAIRREMSYAS